MYKNQLCQVKFTENMTALINPRKVTENIQNHCVRGKDKHQFPS